MLGFWNHYLFIKSDPIWMTVKVLSFKYRWQIVMCSCLGQPSAVSSPVSYLPPGCILWLYRFKFLKSVSILSIFVNIYVFCIFPVFYFWWWEYPKMFLVNMIHTAVLVLKFLIKLRFKQLGDIPNDIPFALQFIYRISLVLFSQVYLFPTWDW